jgi:O-antigen ligase
MDEDRYGDFWFRITSARSKIWDDIFKDWATQPLFKKLMGVDLNYTSHVTGVWAHNDFVEILCSFGIVGLIHYLYAVIHMLRAGYGRARVPVVLSICVFMAWLVNAFFNMHYVYFCAMLCLPFLVFILREYSLEKRGERGSKYLTVQYDKKIEG